MKKLGKKFLTCLFAMFIAMFVSDQAWAANLSFDPSDSVIGIGGMTDVDIVVSGLENDDLGTFDFNVNYDNSVLDFNDYTLGTGLGDISDYDALNWGDGNLGGTIHLRELSLLDDLSFQSDSFALATLSFTGIGMGNSPLSFPEDPILGDFSGDSLSANPESGNISVIPIPGSLWLLGSGLAALAGIRRKFKKRC
ncbi:VPLPA-CTERM sorting domain-containing protein [Desulfococcaceae bacterium HSG8]|nr:VPLPA-CTERM sorting domain-containing protein [Desulfococcaceae bacterium HSG8]